MKIYRIFFFFFLMFVNFFCNILFFRKKIFLGTLFRKFSFHEKCFGTF